MLVRNLFFFLLFPLCCLAQQEKISLKIVLGQIAERHGVKFSYIEEELAVYTLVPPDQNLSLQNKLQYVEAQTRLHFKAVSANYYTIYNERSMDKPLCGYLEDADTGRKIENAHISVAGLSVSVSSDANGYFELPTLSPNTISIKHQSYKEQSVSPQDLYVSGCPVIKLEPIIAPLAEVVTQRYLATGIIKNKFGELIVRPQKFGILPGLTEPDVLQTMQQVPGISSIDETVSNISVRGGAHDQNLFLWNGIRMFQTGHFFGLISAFNSLLPSQITIYRNGSPAFFGESVSSLVDISTHTKIPESSYYTASVDMINSNFLAKLKLSETSALQVSGRRTFSDLFTTPTFSDFKERVFQNTLVTDISQNEQVPVASEEEFYFYDFSIQYQKVIGRHELIFDGIGIENSVDISQRTTTASRTSELDQQNFGASLNWKSEWNERHRSDFQGYLSWYNLDAINESIENNQRTSQRNNVFDKGFRLRHTIIYKNFEISAGYQLDEIRIKDAEAVNDPAFSSASTSGSVSHAAIVESLYRSESGSTQIRGGIRSNYFQRFRTLFVEPRLTFNQAISEKLSLEVALERKSQTLSQIIDLQQDFLGIEKRRWTLANDTTIPIQKSTQTSLGLTYSYNGWLVTVDNFYKKITGITTGGQGFQNQLEFVEAVGDSRVYGSEILVQKSFARFYSWISYSFNDNQYHFSTVTPSKFASNLEITHSVSWAAIYEWRKLRVALGTKWHSGKPVTTPSSFVIDPDNSANSEIIYNMPNSERVGNYMQCNFSASKSWQLNPKIVFAASVSVLNIFDRSNVVNRYYRINPETNTVQSVNTYSLGRTPNVALKFHF